jgi:hypothetical protein
MTSTYYLEKTDGSKATVSNESSLSLNGASPLPSLTHTLEKVHASLFRHLTFGHRRCDKLTHPPRVYIAVNKGEHDETRKQEIQRKLRRMSRFITLGSLPPQV